jgi:hypothetical protein
MLISVQINRTGLFVKNIALKAIDAISKGIIYCINVCAGLSFVVFIIGLGNEFIDWEKTGRWVTLTIHDGFNGTDGKPIPLFSMPGHLGIQNILNKMLYSSYPLTFLILSIVFGYIGLALDGREEKMRILIVLLVLWIVL